VAFPKPNPQVAKPEPNKTENETRRKQQVNRTDGLNQGLNIDLGRLPSALPPADVQGP